MQWIFLFLFSMLLCTHSSAQEVPVEGSVIKGNLIIGRSTFALPPGDWKVVLTSTETVSINNLPAGASSASVYLVQQDTDGAYIASIWHNVPLASTFTKSWTDPLCNRKDTLYRDSFSGRFDFPECLLINHKVGFWLNVPVNANDRKIWEWYAANKIKLPLTVLTGSYRKYFAGDYVNVEVTINPEYFGQDKSLKSVWVESEWHPLIIKNDLKRLDYLENFKKWLYVMVNNASATLKDRKPKLSLLPALDEFNGALTKVSSDLNNKLEIISIEQRLLNLKVLFDKGLISKEQFDAKQIAIIKAL